MSHLAKRRIVALHRFLSAGSQDATRERAPSLDDYEMPASAPIVLAALDHEDLGRAVKMSRATRRASGATLAPLVRRIAHWHDHGLRVVVAARAETQAERLASLLGHLGVRCRVAPTPEPLRGVGSQASLSTENVLDPAARGERGTVDFVASKLSRGVVLVADGLVIVTEEEIFGARAHLRSGARASGDKRADSAALARSFAEDLRSLTVGDYVVHVDHGIGRYQGLVHKDVGGLTVDLLVIEYDAGDKLYLPVYRLNQLQKYSGREGAPPKIDRLGGQTFARTKTRAKKAIRQMADELLRLYAERRAQTRAPFPALDDDYRAFEATFPFDETPDQATRSTT